jgi:hypothetical protein
VSSTAKPKSMPEQSETLSDLWRKQPGFIESKSFRQVIQLAGDGRLRDGSAASRELKEWLAAISLGHLKDCLDQCLIDSFDESAFALQDAANEIGTRLGFKVKSGRYRGVKGEIGYDGLWLGEDQFRFLLEIKTTDAYRINLDTIAKYRLQLISSGEVDPQQSSILIAVGRQDTGDLEAQIRGSRHAWDVRLISLDALVRLAEVKEELNDRTTSSKINQMLRPVEYTRLDPIVELLFAAKRDLETIQETVPPPEIASGKPLRADTSRELEKARAVAIARIAKALGCSFTRRGRAQAESSDGKIRLVCLASQQYEGPNGSKNYWYGFTLAQREYLEQSEVGWLGLAVEQSDRVFLIDWTRLNRWLPELSTTPSSATEMRDVRHWHLSINDYQSHAELRRSGGGVLDDLSSLVLHE